MTFFSVKHKLWPFIRIWVPSYFHNLPPVLDRETTFLTPSLLFYTKKTSKRDILFNKRISPRRANSFFNPAALRKAKIVYNFGLSECNRVKELIPNEKGAKLNSCFL